MPHFYYYYNGFVIFNIKNNSVKTLTYSISFVTG